MTPYRERREAGHYSPDGEPTASTTTADLAGLGAAQPELDVVVNDTEGDTAEPASTGLYDNMTKAELIALAQERGISPANAAMSKADLIAGLEA